MTNKREYIQLNLFGRAPEIIVDIHEVQRNRKNSITLLLDYLRKHKIEFAIQKLDVADLVLPNGYAVERKSIRDFLNSLMGDTSGRPRLFEQLRALSQAYEKPILFLEGSLSIRMDLRDKAIFIPISKKQIRKRIYTVIEERIGVHPNAFLGALNRIREMGIRIIESFDAFHGAELLWKLYQEAKGINTNDSERRSVAIVRTKPRLHTLYEQQLFFLSGLPGISVLRAEKILSIYKNPYNAIAKVKRWDIDVEGIGPKTLEKVLKVLFTDVDQSKTSEDV